MKDIVFRRSRKSFLSTYLFSLLFLLLVFSCSVILELPPFLIYLLTFPSIYLVLLPEYTIINEKTVIKSDSVEYVCGVLARKKAVIPFDRIANIGVTKSVLGRMFNFGNIFINGVGGGENRIVLRGVKNPEKILKIIEGKIGKKEPAF